MFCNVNSFYNCSFLIFVVFVIYENRLEHVAWSSRNNTADSNDPMTFPPARGHNSKLYTRNIII